jgi:hypothetical protein
MKVMNQIGAPQAGRVARVFVADATPIEYGTPRSSEQAHLASVTRWVGWVRKRNEHRFWSVQ